MRKRRRKRSWKQKKKLWYEGKSKEDINKINDKQMLELIHRGIREQHGWEIVSLYRIRQFLNYRYSMKDIMKRLRDMRLNLHVDYDGFSSNVSIPRNYTLRSEKIPKSVEYV